MNGYVLYKDGSYDKLYRSGKISSLKHAAIVLLEMKSYLFGTAYFKLPPCAFKKIANMKDIKFSYEFYDGQLIDDEDDVTVVNKYRYKNSAQLLKKISEICISEDVLNDSFWLFDCYVCYAFDNLKLSYDISSGHYEYSDLGKFYHDIGLYDDKDDYRDNYEFITLSNSSWKNRRSYRKLKKDKTFVYYGTSVYFEIDKSFYEKIKELKFSTFVRIYEYEQMSDEDRESFDEIFNETRTTYEYKRKRHGIKLSTDIKSPNNRTRSRISSSIHDLLQTRFGADVVAQLESTNEVFYYRLHSIINFINGKKVKRSKNRLNKFVSKYFPAIPDSTDDEITSNADEHVPEINSRW